MGIEQAAISITAKNYDTYRKVGGNGGLPIWLSASAIDTRVLRSLDPPHGMVSGTGHKVHYFFSPRCVSMVKGSPILT